MLAASSESNSKLNCTVGFPGRTPTHWLRQAAKTGTCGPTSAMESTLISWGRGQMSLQHGQVPTIPGIRVRGRPRPAGILAVILSDLELSPSELKQLLGKPAASQGGPRLVDDILGIIFFKCNVDIAHNWGRELLTLLKFFYASGQLVFHPESSDVKIMLFACLSTATTQLVAVYDPTIIFWLWIYG